MTSICKFHLLKSRRGKEIWLLPYKVVFYFNCLIKSPLTVLLYACVSWLKRIQYLMCHVSWMWFPSDYYARKQFRPRESLLSAVACSQISVSGNLFSAICVIFHHHYSRLPSVWVLIELSVRFCGVNRVRQSKLSRKSDVHIDLEKLSTPSLTGIRMVECETVL